MGRRRSPNPPVDQPSALPSPEGVARVRATLGNIEEFTDADAERMERRDAAAKELLKDSAADRKRRATLEILHPHIHERWRGFDGGLYVSIEAAGRLRNILISSGEFEDSVVDILTNESFPAPDDPTISAVARTLKAEARRGPAYPTFIRFGWDDRASYLDLADDNGTIIRIDRDGWGPVNDCPLKFVQPAGQKPLPMPELTDECIVDLLRKIWTLSSDDHPILIASFLQCCFHPGPKPLLAIWGPQGSGKTMLARQLRKSVDDHLALVRAMPADPRDFSIGAANSAIVAFDNQSPPSWAMSDLLCQLCTGLSTACRELYSDRSESIISVTRPVIINGIGEITTRPDLADRTISIALPVIAEGQRQTEAEIWMRFADLHPKILGAILIGVSASWRNADTIKLDDKPRMADFCLTSCAAAEGFGWTAADFMRAFRASAEDLIGVSIESSALATAILRFLDQPEVMGSWSGNATALQERLDQMVSGDIRRSKSWPKSSMILGTELRRVEPVLKKIGVTVENTREPGRNRGRIIKLSRMPGPEDA